MGRPIDADELVEQILRLRAAPEKCGATIEYQISIGAWCSALLHVLYEISQLPTWKESDQDDT